MLSVKQGDLKYHFLSLWYDLMWNWTSVSQTIGEQNLTVTKHYWLSVYAIYIVWYNFKWKELNIDDRACISDLG